VQNSGTKKRRQHPAVCPINKYLVADLRLTAGKTRDLAKVLNIRRGFQTYEEPPTRGHPQNPEDQNLGD